MLICFQAYERNPAVRSRRDDEQDFPLSSMCLAWSRRNWLSTATRNCEKLLRLIASLDLEDEKLLEEDNLGPQDSKGSRHHNKAVPWLKKTEYISTEFNRYGVSNDKTETKVGYNVKKLFKEENLYMDRESQINAINKTFEDAQTPIEKHCSKPESIHWKYCLYFLTLR
ncbi:RNA polymerase II-associated factor 1 homolog [Tachypleus tridentatus]|uniref:RNA polymerase II-associated factor 1 homolog n=1 Tax=Tachypleus tridentatus TaxID=6853 RepID=UPI003FD520B9